MNQVVLLASWLVKVPKGFSSYNFYLSVIFFLLNPNQHCKLFYLIIIYSCFSNKFSTDIFALQRQSIPPSLQLIIISSIIICLIMIASDQKYKFVIFPKTIIIKGIYFNSELPQYCISLFKGNFKQDETIIVPIRQQKLYHTYFVLPEGRLEFYEREGDERSWQSRKIVVYENGNEIGFVRPAIEEYLANYQDFNTKFYNERFRLNDKLDLEFELFMGGSEQQVSELLVQYKGESNIKTPLTVVSKEREADLQDLDRLLVRHVQSQLYTPKVLPGSRNKILEQDEQDQESVRSSIPLTSPVASNKGFSINLKAVPSKPHIQATTSTSVTLQANILGEFWGLPLKEKLTFLLFATISIGLIYMSMLPIKRI